MIRDWLVDHLPDFVIAAFRYIGSAFEFVDLAAQMVALGVFVIFYLVYLNANPRKTLRKTLLWTLAFSLLILMTVIFQQAVQPILVEKAYTPYRVHFYNPFIEKLYYPYLKTPLQYLTWIFGGYILFMIVGLPGIWMASDFWRRVVDKFRNRRDR